LPNFKLPEMDPLMLSGKNESISNKFGHWNCKEVDGVNDIFLIQGFPENFILYLLFLIFSVHNYRSLTSFQHLNA